MVWVLKLTAVAMVSGLFAVLLQKTAPVNALMLSMAVTVMLALASISFLEPILNFLQRLEKICGVSSVYSTTLIKCMLISLITRLGVSICKDAGQAGMASMLVIGGTLSAVWIAIPMLEALLSMLEGFL